MKARRILVRVESLLALGLVLAGCTGPAPAATTPAASTPTAATAAPSTSATATATGSSTPTSSPTASATPAKGTLSLSGTAIGDRPLGSTPSSRVEPDLVARFGKPRVGRPELCHVAGDRNQFAMVDHRFGGPTVHYARRGGTTFAIGWQVALDRVPDGLRLADRLEWRPTFAALSAANGVAVDTADGMTVARLTGRAISYTGQAGADRPDTVSGGPDLICR